MRKIDLSKSTFLILFLAVGFFVGISFSSVYAGMLIETEDIADDAITTEKIKNRQVKNPDIRGNTIKSGKIKDGTITVADIDPAFMKINHLEDFNNADCEAGSTITPGWCPNDIRFDFLIIDNALTGDGLSVVLISLDDGPQTPGRGCTVQDETPVGFGFGVRIICVNPPFDGTALNYVIFHP